MFTIDQIKAAHAKVKSGADFPAYARELKELGVLYYENYVADGHTVYRGLQGYTAEAGPKYAVLAIAGNSSAEELKRVLLIHQQGQTDYLTFCCQASGAGVEKWKVDLDGMTCTYYDRQGQAMVVEAIS